METTGDADRTKEVGLEADRGEIEENKGLGITEARRRPFILQQTLWDILALRP